MAWVLVAPGGYVYWAFWRDGRRQGWERLRDAERHRVEAGLMFTDLMEVPDDD